MEYLNIEQKEDFQIIQMNRPKVNALNFQLVEEIRRAFKLAEEDNNIRGVILTGLPKVFSAGLDIPELFDYDDVKIREFMTSFGLMHVELVKFSKPFICAINGHSPAGGTVIALGADHRIMVNGDKFKIGLNEVSVNVQISTNLITAYKFWLGQGTAYKNIMAGKLLNPQEALESGLVDDLVADEDELISKAEQKMRSMLFADSNILSNTKYKLRRTWINSLEDYDQEDLEQVLEVWWDPEVRMKMQMFIAMLKNRG